MLVKGYSLQEETVLEIGKFTILWNWFELGVITIVIQGKSSK